MMAPRVTVIVPIRDEEERLAGCLDAIAGQDLEPELVEVLVIDGGSTDSSVAVARQLLAGRGWARAEVLHCAAGDRSSNLNVGLAAAATPILVRVDARSRIPSHYVRRCVEVLDERGDVAVVGGRQRAVTADGGAVSVGVARALNNRWAMGLSRYRRATTSGAADTVYLGAYRTAELRAAGGWRTDLAVNEDFDLNRRLAQNGMVWFDALLTVDYLPRSSLPALARQYWAFGLGKSRYWAVSGDRPRPRQLALLAAPPACLALLGAVLVGSGPDAAGACLLTGLGVGLFVEVVGADAPRAGLRGHIAALAAMVCVSGGWLAGVGVGSFRSASPATTVGRPVERAA